MITVKTKSSSNVKEVVRFFNRNFPEAVLKVDYSVPLKYSVLLFHSNTEHRKKVSTEKLSSFR